MVKLGRVENAVLVSFLGDHKHLLKSAQLVEKTMTKTFEKTTIGTNRTRVQWKKMADGTIKDMKLIEGEFTKFRFEFLSILFFGMSMDRMFGGIRKRAIDTYSKITEGQTKFGQQMTKTNAEMQILNFELAEAMAPAMTTLTEAGISLARTFADLPEPLKEMGGMLIVGGEATGKVLGSVGQMYLGFAGISQLLGSKGTGAGGVGGSGVLGKMSIMQGVASALAAGIGISFILEGMTELEEDFADGIGRMMEGAGLILMAGKKSKQGAAIYAVGIAARFASDISMEETEPAIRRLLDDLGTLGIFSGILSKNPYIFAVGLVLTVRDIEIGGVSLSGIARGIGRRFAETAVGIVGGGRSLEELEAIGRQTGRRITEAGLGEIRPTNVVNVTVNATGEATQSFGSLADAIGYEVERRLTK